jgi:hypothetical protein
MAKAKKVVKKVAKKFLSVPPKISQLKDLERVYSTNVTNTDFQRLVQFAIPELGKQISKAGLRGYSTTVEALGHLSSISGEFEDLVNFYESKRILADELGFCDATWQREAKCGSNLGTVDFDDLYERDLEVEIVVHVRRRLKTKDKLVQFGLK